jgi:anaerobic ribonucleoside-triphosphate reductase activating protein
MAKRILNTGDIEGVTYTGGEPMLQAHALVLLSQLLRQHGLTVFCFTGYKLEMLRKSRNPWVCRFLDQIDILIDGPFVQVKATPLLWRGSANQGVHFLSETYREWAPIVEHGPAQVEFVVNHSHFTTIGTWPKDFVERLEQQLQR